jgi:deazaflavin-dependent oxidoreductase (nitroreductase family)
VPIPRAVTSFNRDILNPGMRHLVGIGPMAEVEHLGRRSGRTYRTPIMAFRDGTRVTIALTYGRDVDWLRNVRAADGCRMRLGGHVLTLGPPRDVPTAQGLARVSPIARTVLPLIQCRDFVELPVLSEDGHPVRGR